MIGDHHRLRQILLNLTNNAQKFTSKGVIRVIIQPVMPVVDDLALIRFEIQDTGMGFPVSRLKDFSTFLSDRSQPVQKS